MNAVLTIAVKEAQEGLRNRWVLAATLLLASLALALTFLGSAPTGAVGASALDVVVVSLSSLTIFLAPLIALLLSHDAIIGEIERGSMLLLLSYPVSRAQVVLGKFSGHVAILAFATLVGYGAAGAALWLSGAAIDRAGLFAFAAMIASSIALGAAFAALGYLASALASSRGMAAGAAIGVWLVFALVYDMALLATLVADQGRFVTGRALEALLLLNPADAYRLLNLGAFADVGAFSGMAGLTASATLSPVALVAALILWTALPLAAAAAVFMRREL
ncbi:ABC transporter permease subunit [Methylocella sp.]|uniref:ABC transporter permease subunit n=1 Tax=Methylocella sp. TaxID=1978226 RepID=UPI0037847ED5